jgi:hypothetical protein
MARKSARKTVATGSRTQKGRKNLGEPSSRLQRLNGPKGVKAKNPPLPQDSSSSDDIDEDYAEFLKTYVPEEDVDEDYAEFLRTHDPQKFYHTGYSSEGDGASQVTTQRDSQATMESKVKAEKSSGSKPLK